MEFLRRLFGAPRLPPLLFRVRLGTEQRSTLAEGDVLVRGTRSPDGETFHLRPVAAQGVVLVPWPGGRRAEFILQKGDRAGRISVTADEAVTGLVREVVLG